MMSAEKKVTVIELPYTESVSCFLEQKGKYIWSFTFIKDGATVLFKGNILNPDQDKLIELISENMSEYFSSYGISGLNAAVSAILNAIENPQDYLWKDKEDVDIMSKSPAEDNEVIEEKKPPIAVEKTIKKVEEPPIDIIEVTEKVETPPTDVEEITEEAPSIEQRAIELLEKFDVKEVTEEAPPIDVKEIAEEAPPIDVKEITEEAPPIDVKEITEKKEHIIEAEEVTETKTPPVETIEAPATIPEDKTELLIKEIKVEGGRETLQIFAKNESDWRVVAIPAETEIQISSKDIDVVADALNECIEFFSFSGAYDAAEKLVTVLNNITDYLPKEEKVSESISDEGHIEEGISLDEQIRKLRTVEDVDRYIELMRDSVKDEDRMAFLKDVRVSHVEDVMGHVYRRGADKWLLSFSSISSGEQFSKPLPIAELTEEEVAKILNQGIPQISLSAALLAAEKVLMVIQELRERPQEVLVINQAVEHFLEVVQGQGDINKATKLATALLTKFGELKNPLGVLKFGSKAISYQDMRENFAEANKLRKDVAEQLLELDVDLFIEFADESINVLIEREQLLDASKLCTMLVNALMQRKDFRVTVQYMKKTIEILQKANLMRSLAENSVEYSEFLLKNIDRVAEEDQEFGNLIKEEIVEFFTSALNFYETQEDRFDLLETTEKIINLLSETNLEEETILFSQRGIKYFQEAGNDEKVLELASKLSKKLMKEEEKKYLKALEFVNAVIKVYIDQGAVEQIIEFGFDIVDDLIKINVKSEAREYLLMFTDFAIQAYENDFERTAEITINSASKMREIGESKEVIDRLFTLIEYAEDIDEALAVYHEKALPMLCKEGDFKFATEFVDQVSEYITQLGGPNAPKRVAEFNFSFAKALLNSENYDIALEYLERAYDSYLESGDTYTAIKVYLDTYEIFLNTKQFEEGFKVLSAISDYYQEKRLLRLLIPILENTTDILIKNEAYNIKYITQVSQLYEEMADLENAISTLVKYRDILQDKDLNLSMQLTELTLNRTINLENDYRAGIDVLKPFVEFLIQQKNYETAYKYITQIREYLKISKGIGKGTVLFTQYKDQILKTGDTAWADRLVELIVEMNLSEHRETIAAIISKEFAEQLFSLKQYSSGVKHAKAAAQYFFNSEKQDDALEFLQQIYESFETDTEIDVTNQAEIIKTLAELREKTDEWTNGAAFCIRFAKKLLDAETPAISLANEMMSTAVEITRAHDLTKTIEIAQTYIDKLDALGRYEDSVQFVLEIIKAYYSLKNPDAAENYAKQTIRKLLNTHGINRTQQFVKTLVNEVKDPKALENLLLTLSEEFTSAEFIEAARTVFEEVLQTLQQENRTRVSARLYEKFAYLVQEFSAELMLEYAYKAADHYRSLEDHIGMSRVFEKLSDALAFDDFDRAVKVLKRCIFVLKQLNANFALQNLILHLDEREITLRAMELGLDVKQLLEIE